MTSCFLLLQLAAPGADHVLGQVGRAAGSAGGMFTTAGFILAGIALVVGAFAGHALDKIVRGMSKSSGTARWPEDWPKPLFTRDDTQAGYLDVTPEEAMNAKAQPFGRTYPRLRLFPNIYPLRGLRRRVEYATSRPVYIPYKKRFQHVAILGGTGKGKSTSFVIPALAYGAMEPDTAYFAIDVKSPEFLRTFGPSYQKSKPVYFVDPWTPQETMAFEPVWRATGEKKKIVAEVISSYSLDPSPPSGESGNSEFFKLAANRLIRALLDIAQFWPRRYAKLPCVAQLVGAGGNAIKEAVERLDTLLPEYDGQPRSDKYGMSLKQAIETLVSCPSSDFRPGGRRPEVSAALKVLDSCGYEIATVVRGYRRVRFGNPRSSASKPAEGAALEKATKEFWEEIDRLWAARQVELRRIVKAMGEFVQMPEDTRNSVVSTVQNKIEWFTDKEIARVFSKDEMDPDRLVQHPCLMLIGAPMSKLQIGSLFVSAIITNLAINAVFQRGQHLTNNELGKKVSKHGVFLMLDEFPQLNVKDAHKSLATMRSFLTGMCMIYQDRGQLKQIYGDNVTTVESNTIHRIILQGVHEEAAEFYATKSMGKARIRKENVSKTDGESKRNVSIQEENVDLMSANDIIYMKLNGEARPDMALNLNKDFDPFPMKPIPFYEDPVCQKLLGMKKSLVKTDISGKKTMKFWQWQERWSLPPVSPKPLLTRLHPLPANERAAGASDPVWERMNDPYNEYVEYVAPELRAGYDELRIVDLDFPSIAVEASNPDPQSRMSPAEGGFPPFPPSSHQSPFPPQSQAPVSNEMLVPMYSRDMRLLMNDDFQQLEPLEDRDPLTGSMSARAEEEGDTDEDYEDDNI